MSFTECADDSNQWDYKCPQFCDLTATETEDQLREIDNFFEVDHENSGNEGLVGHQTPDHLGGKVANTGANAVSLEDNVRYETPPQNKENLEDDDEVFYSTKKYLSVEKLYKFRSTPMRVLQHNGSTPLRESRLSSKKKKKSNKKKPDSLAIQIEETTEQMVFSMEKLMQSLPLSATPETAEENCENEAKNELRSPRSEPIVEKVEPIVEKVERNEVIAEGLPSDDVLPPVSNEEVVDRRLSYVIEKPQKTVTLVSPTKRVRKSGHPSTRRKATPLRRSVSKVSTASVVARLYSTAKKREDNYKSLAELLKEFETGPRGSARSRSTDRSGCAVRSRSSSVSSLTRAKSPNLQSIKRDRPLPRKTEDVIASQIKKYSFKANPIRKKLFDPKFASGIPRVKSTKEPTKSVEMHFRTAERATKHSDDESSHNKTDFKFKANPMPSFRTPQYMPKLMGKKPTTFRPFSFDQQIQQLVAKKRTNSEGSQPMAN